LALTSVNVLDKVTFFESEPLRGRTPELPQN